jgi:2-iminobutanoate/2-iminopropanoate deaminase
MGCETNGRSLNVERISGATGFTLSDAVVIEGTGRWIHVSGQIARGAGEKPLKGDLGAQANVCFDQIDEVLRACDGSLADVARITAYVTSLDDYAAYNRVRGERFASSPPASTTVQVAGLLGEGALIEIDAVAFVAA